MKVWNPLFPLFTVAIWIALLSIILRYFKKPLVAEPLPGDQFLRIEGMRGLLAVFVVTHHVCTSFALSTTGVWITQTSFVRFLGSETVRGFFMITGFLFWRKILLGEKMPFLPFYRRRFLRLMPAYYVAIVCMLLALGGLAEPFDFHSVVLGTSDLLPWLFVGFPHGFFPDLLAYPTWTITAGVFWTLHWEWIFYLSLPFLALYQRRSLTWITLTCCCGLALMPRITPVFWKTLPENPVAIFTALARFVVCSFGPGLVIAHFSTAQKRIDSEPFQKWRECCAVAITVGVFAAPFGKYELAYSTGMAVIGYLLICTKVFHWVFKNIAVRFLGEKSYSIYLFHGLLLTGLRTLGFMHPWVFKNSFLYWGIICFGVGPVLFTVASVSFRYLEKPFINSRKIARGSLKGTDIRPCLAA